MKKMLAKLRYAVIEETQVAFTGYDYEPKFVTGFTQENLKASRNISNVIWCPQTLGAPLMVR